MKTNEFYYLLLVVGAFGGFAIAMVVATLRYKSWVKHNEPQRH